MQCQDLHSSHCHPPCLQLRRLSGAAQALKRGALSAASFGAALLAPLMTAVMTSVPVSVSDLQIAYKVHAPIHSVHRMVPSAAASIRFRAPVTE